jgi:hypothetical protein
VIFMLTAIVGVLCVMLFFTPSIIEGAAPNKPPLQSTQYCKIMDPRPSCRKQATQTKTTVTTGKTVTTPSFAQTKVKK